MTELFLKILNMSITASIGVILVILLRFILKKTPKWVNVLLWGLVAIRLICPFSPESPISMIPKTDWITGKVPYTEEELAFDSVPETIRVDEALNSDFYDSVVHFYPVEPNVVVYKSVSAIWVLSLVWICGMAAMMIYLGVSYFCVYRRIRGASLLRDNIYRSEVVSSPFVFGIIKPRICLPQCLREDAMDFVIAHEKAHIKRRDHWWKPLGFLLLAVHWFNPLIWLSYILLCRDIEMACDERVVKGMGISDRADYSEALLSCSLSEGRSYRALISACPLAFGEVGVKERIKSVLHYKKPAFWIVVLAIVVSFIAAACILTNPINKENVGIHGIFGKTTDRDSVMVILKYSYPTGSYSVRLVPEDEGEYCGDGMTEYDGALGQYRLMFSTGDTELAEGLRKEFPAGEVVELDVPPMTIRVKCVYPSDHGCCIYFGFDHPIEVEAVSDKKLNPLGGTVRIPITFLEIPKNVTEYLYTDQTTEITSGHNDLDKGKELQIKLLSSEGPELVSVKITCKPDIYLVLREANGWLEIGETSTFLIPENCSYTVEASAVDGKAGNVTLQITEKGEGGGESECDIVPAYVVETSYEMACTAFGKPLEKEAYSVRKTAEDNDNTIEIVFSTNEGQKYVSIFWTREEKGADWTLRYPDTPVVVCDPEKWLSSDVTVFLTLEDVVELSKKGDQLTLTDFARYAYTDVGSGMFVWLLPIDETFHMLIGGGSLDSAPMYAYLVAADGIDENRMDIRLGDVEAFIRAPFPTEQNEFGILIRSGDSAVTPVPHLQWANKLTEHGWVSVDGKVPEDILHEDKNMLPSILYRDDFELELGNHVTLTGVDVYSENLECLHRNASPDVLGSLPTGNYCVSVNVQKQGDYVPALDMYETAAYCCLFRLVCE